METKGIILAGGRGTRLFPLTSIISKQLQPIYDKPMIYYPLATLMLAGIRNILIISTPEDTPLYSALLGDGSRWGINLQYAVQKKPAGLPEAFIIGENFINKYQVSLILGDNLFYGKLNFYRDAITKNKGASIFAYRVENPQDYGIVEFDHSGKILSIEEKPNNPNSHYAIPGLYIFKSDVVDVAKNLEPGKRGELEITDVLINYFKRELLAVENIGRGVAWLDTGTPGNLIDAGNFIRAIELRQGRKIACLEEIALVSGFIDDKLFLKTVNSYPDCDYKKYCLSIFNDYKLNLL